LGGINTGEERNTFEKLAKGLKKITGGMKVVLAEC
jgi:hypothetical protein